MTPHDRDNPRRVFGNKNLISLMGSRDICSQVCDRRNPKISFLKPYPGGGSKPDRTCGEGGSGGRRLIDESHSQVIKHCCFGLRFQAFPSFENSAAT